MAEKKLTFEQAMARLEEIVAQLEAGDHPLAESLSLYEEGDETMRRHAGQSGAKSHEAAPGRDR